MGTVMAQYSVYLIPTRSREDSNRQAEDRPIVSPITGDELDFFDSGVWLTREHGRNFFPYDQIRTIKEHPSDEGPDPTEESSSEA